MAEIDQERLWRTLGKIESGQDTLFKKMETIEKKHDDLHDEVTEMKIGGCSIGAGNATRIKILEDQEHVCCGTDHRKTIAIGAGSGGVLVALAEAMRALFSHLGSHGGGPTG